MKIFAILTVCFAIISGLFAASGTQVAIVNTGKSAVLKIKKSNGIKIREYTKKDRKTGMQNFRCVFFSLSKGNKEQKISFSIEAANGDMTIYIGNKKMDYFVWKSLKFDGKELIDPKKGGTFNVRQFKIGKIDKLKEIKFEAVCRGANRKEISAASKAQKSSRRNKNKRFK